MTMAGAHKSLFKSRSFSLDTNESRQRRVDENCRLRNERRDKELNRLRSSSKPADFEEFLEVFTTDIEMLDVNNNNVTGNSWFRQDWLDKLQSDSSYHQLFAVQRIRRVIRQNPEAGSEAIKLGLVSRFFNFLQVKDYSRLQKEGAEVLSDISSNKNLNSIPENCSQILGSALEAAEDELVVEPLLTVIGNISGKFPDFREEILGSPTLDFILNLLKTTKSYWLLSSGTYALSNLWFRNRNSRNFDKIQICVEVLADLVQHEDIDIIYWACHALGDIAALSVQPVIESSACQRLVELLRFNWLTKVNAAAVRAVERITKWGEEPIQRVIDLNGIPALFHLLNFESEKIICRTCYVLQNIALGSSRHIQTILDGGFIPVLVKLLSHEDERVQLEALTVIRCCISRKRTSISQVQFLVSAGIVEELFGKLCMENNEVLHAVLRSLKELLEFGLNEIREKLMNENVIQKIAELSDSNAKEVSKYAKKIVNLVTNC